MAKVTIIDSNLFETPQYKPGDEQTITSIAVNSTFSVENGRVESIVYDLGGNLLNYNPNAKYSAVENGVGGDLFTADALLVYPEEEVTDLGLEIGTYNVLYNFLNNELNSSFAQPFSIKEISANRKEVRLTTSFTSAEDLQELVDKIYPENIISPSYPDFYLNFGQGRLAIANNILFDNSNNQYSVLIKLYDPLPSFVEEREAVWISTNQRDQVTYQVEFEQEILVEPKKNVLKGPNFSLPINNQVHNSVKLTSLSELQNLSGITTASRRQLGSLLNEKGIEVNIDYSKFNNFIHFSSAEERMDNFYYKISLIESKSNLLSGEPTGNDTYLSASRAILQNEISSIIDNFDGFEYWMYYTSGTYGGDAFPQPFPKTTTKKPYTLASSGSAAALNWKASASLSGSEYDDNNPNNLIYTIPEYLREDSDNAPYEKFIGMVGQHFDTLYTYAQDITNRYNADNRLDFGISKDLVGEAIRSMGINLYTGNFNAYDLVDSLVGTRVPNTLPDGQTNVNNYVTASSDVVPVEDVNKEIYKRIYHNLPLLIRQKGSYAGLRTLITTFGIPEEIFPVKEFDIKYIATTQSLPAVGTSGSIDFLEGNIELPPNEDNNPPQTLLSPTVRVQQNSVKSESYDRSLHYVEAGFSPQGYIDENTHTSFNPLGTDFPDFEDFYFGSNPNYYGSKFVGGDSAATQTVTWDFSAYIRYIKFFDSSLFNMIKDFVPVRSSTATGVIIKPTIKERQRQRPAQLTYENVIYSGSADTQYYDWSETEYVKKAIGDYDKRLKTGSFQYAGSTGGSLTNSNRYAFSASDGDWGNYDLSTPVVGLVQTWSESVYTVMGYAQQYLQTGSKALANATHIVSHGTQDEFYNGIFKQTGQLAGNYLTREISESYDASAGAGVIRTDNNLYNFYKRPSNNIYAYTGKVQITSVLEFLESSANIIQNTSAGVVYFKLGVDNTTAELFQANGNILSFDVAGEAVTFTVGAPTQVSNASATYMAFLLLDNPSLNESVFNGAAAVNYIGAYDVQDETRKPGPWAYNDNNPVINNSFDPGAGLVNYSGIRKSTFYQDADYSGAASSSLVPINVDLLASGSASKAAVQDSNYSSQWWVNSRYLGVRRSSPDFNIRIVRAIPDVSELFTSESLGFNPFTSKSTPDQPQLPADR